jgi:hypothetical protein
MGMTSVLVDLLQDVSSLTRPTPASKKLARKTGIFGPFRGRFCADLRVGAFIEPYRRNADTYIGFALDAALYPKGKLP